MADKAIPAFHTKAKSDAELAAENARSVSSETEPLLAEIDALLNKEHSIEA